MRKKTEVNFSISSAILFAATVALLLQIISFLVPSQFIVVNDQFIFGQFGNNILAIIFLSIASLIGIFIIKQNFLRNSQIWIALLLSGLLSNLYERIFHHGVIDYLNIGFIPTFNIADLLIVLSIAGVATKLFLYKKTS